MKKTLLLALLVIDMITSCTKPANTTNNYGSGQPPFVISGLTDVTFTNGTTQTFTLSLGLQYTDSSQAPVTMSLSSLPAGITIDTTWITSGTPTFTTTLTFYDTTAAGAAPGTYPMTITVSGANTKKVFTFNLKVLPPPPCTSFVVGKYINAQSFCSSNPYIYYTDSVYADAAVNDKIWFTNFNNTSQLVYGLITSCGSTSTDEITIVIPSQTVGGTTFAGSGIAPKYYNHEVFITLTSPQSCEFEDE